MTTKNPFEIRLDVLKMAQDMNEQAYQESKDMAWSMIEKTADYQEKTMDDMKAYFDAIKPPMYTPEDVIKKAEELYKFVTTKD